MSTVVRDDRKLLSDLQHGLRLRRKAAIPRVILVIVVLATFYQAFHYDFINYDDRHTLAQNPLMNPPTWHSLKVWWTTPSFDLYVPVMSTIQGGLALLASVPLDPLNGDTLNPWIFHAANIFLHIGTTLLVFQLCLELDVRPWPACAGAMLFGIHPVQVEPVVWITSIKDMLYGFFGAFAIWSFLLSLKSSSPHACGPLKRRVMVNSIVATLCFLLAVLSKPMAVCLPLIALPLVWARYGTVPKKARNQLAVWVLIAIPCCVIAKFAQPAPYSVPLPVWKRVLVAGDALAFYLFKIIWPKTLLLFYGRNPDYVTWHGFLWWTWTLPAIVLAVLWLKRRRCAQAFAGFCIFVAGLLPVMGFVGFSYQYYSTVADRYLYVPMLGIALITAWAVGHAGRSLWIVAAVWLSVLASRTFVQISYWQDSLTLFAHVIEYDPSSALGFSNLGTELLRRRDMAKALVAAKRSIELDPNRCEAYETAGKALYYLGRTEESLRIFSEGYRHDFRTAELLNDFTLDLLKDGRTQDAVSFAKLDVKLSADAVAYVNFGAALAETNQWQPARQALEKAVSMDGTNYNAHCDLAAVLYHDGDASNAIAQYRAAMKLDPDDPRASEALRQLRNAPDHP